MITLAKKIKEERDKKEKGDHGTGNTKSGRTSIRDKLLTKEVTELEENVPGELIATNILYLLLLRLF